MKEKMLAFMDANKYCVVSTVDYQNRPESAFVAFSNDGLELFIGTSSKSRKYTNLTANPNIAIVIADENNEVQYEGKASPVTPQEYLAVEERHISKSPGSAKYRNDPDQQYVRVVPAWIRFIEHGDPDIIEEFTEFLNES